MTTNIVFNPNCQSCRGTGGPMSCPIHGPWATTKQTTPSEPIALDPTPTLWRIADALERIAAALEREDGDG